MNEQILQEMGRQAVSAKYALQKLTATEKNKALLHASEALLSHTEEILSANEKDIKAGKEKGMHEGLLDRLALTETRIAAMAEGLRQIAALEDPIGEIMDTFTRPNGLKSAGSFRRYRHYLRIPPQRDGGCLRLMLQSGKRSYLKGWQ